MEIIEKALMHSKSSTILTYWKFWKLIYLLDFKISARDVFSIIILSC